jgi:glycerol uptake facilitator-like aquaporin
MFIVKRSTALQGWAVAQWWLFCLAPILGASAAGFFYSWLLAA